MARIELSNIGGGGGTTLSLTTTGTSGAATLAGSVLNIPVYQGQLTLTTTGTSGAATLVGDTLNIPQYSGGGTPAGAAGQVQFNSTPAGSFAASANLAWDNTAVQLNINTPLSPTGKLNVKGSGTTSATVNTRLTDSGNTELLKVLDNGSTNIGTGFNWDNVNNRLGIGTASPSQVLHVAGATRMDGTNAIADNRNNGFLTQSASTVVSNRESVWGNGGYAKLRAHTKGFYVGASFPAVNYLFYVDGGTATGILDREGIYIRPTQPAAGGNTNGGDVIIELPSGTGTGRRGEVLIGTATATGPSAIVEISSTNQGLLLPRMTGAQAEAIPIPADGLLVYANNGNGAVITSVGFWGYSAGTWSKLN